MLGKWHIFYICYKKYRMKHKEIVQTSYLSLIAYTSLICYTIYYFITHAWNDLEKLVNSSWYIRSQIGVNRFCEKSCVEPP